MMANNNNNNDDEDEFGDASFLDDFDVDAAVVAGRGSGGCSSKTLSNNVESRLLVSQKRERTLTPSTIHK